MAEASKARETGKFASVHASLHNHFSQERHLITKDLYRERRSTALAEWRSVLG
jgi:putative transposase